MGGSYLGGKKAEKTNKERYGEDWYVKIGRIGGQNGHTCGILVSKGYAMNIKGYEQYQILSTGVVIGVKGKPMKPQIDKKGYLRVQLKDKTKSNGVATLKVHRLVASHFLNNPENLPQVDHIDGDKSNNDVSNLEWVSNEENQRRAVANGVYKKRLPEQIKEYGGKILFAITQGYIAKDLFDKYDISRKTFWRAYERGDFSIVPELPDISDVRKKAYYYYDKNRNKWRVERSDLVKVGKQFETESEAREYASECIRAGGFYGDSERATRAGAFGGRISIRGCKLIKKVGNQYTYKDNKTGKTVTRTIPDELLALKSSLKTAKSA